MTLPADPRLAVIVVNWNGGDTILDCLRALGEQEDKRFETLLIDNCSSDGSVQRVREQYPHVAVLELDRNYGFAEACNRGIVATQGDWVLTLNSDAFADRRWIAELRKAMLQLPDDVGMLQSHVVFADRPNLTNSTGVNITPAGAFIDRDYSQPERPNREVEEIFCPSAAAAAYRRDMLHETRLASGYFDATFYMYYEDVDLGWRCRLAGWRARYVPTAIVRHVFHGSSRRRGELFVPSHCMRNRARTMLKNASLRMLLRGGKQAARDLVWLARHQGIDGARQYFAASLDGIRQRPAVSRIARRARLEIEQHWARD